MNIGDIFTAEITQLEPHGCGVCLVKNKNTGTSDVPVLQVVFVPLGIPGQTIVGQVNRKKKRSFWAEIIEIKKQSAHFVEPKEASFPQTGGALWQHISYDEQLKWKQQFVHDALTRLGGFVNPPILPIVPSPITERYRNKMEYSFGCEIRTVKTHEDGSKTFTDKNPGLGLHRRGNWREIVRIDDSILAPRVSTQILQVIEDFVLNSPLAPLNKGGEADVWNPLPSKGFWREVVIRTSQKGEVLIHLKVNSVGMKELKNEVGTGHDPVASTGQALSVRKILQPLVQILTEKFLQIISIGVTDYQGQVSNQDDGYDLLYGQPYLHENFAALRFQVSALAFFQVNTLAAEKLIEVIEALGDFQKDQILLDLYCGTGTLGLALSSKVGSVYGIEIIADAIRDAEQNAKRNDIQNCHFFAGSVEDSLPEVLREITNQSMTNDECGQNEGVKELKNESVKLEEVGANPCIRSNRKSEIENRKLVALVDPPRAGLTKQARKFLRDLPCQKMIMVSCNQTTLARDLQYLGEYGWQLKQVQPVDLFPHTPHVEAVAVVERA